jgi:hypothetical protein
MADNNEFKGVVALLGEAVENLKTLTQGVKQDLAFSRQAKYTGWEHRSVTLAAANVPQFLEFSEPVTQVAISVPAFGTATIVYVDIEGTAGLDGVQLTAGVPVLNLGELPVKRVSFMCDTGSTTVVQIAGLRGA